MSLYLMTYNYATFAVKNFVFVDPRIKAFLTKLNDYWIWWAENHCNLVGNNCILVRHVLKIEMRIMDIYNKCTHKPEAIRNEAI